MFWFPSSALAVTQPVRADETTLCYCVEQITMGSFSRVLFSDLVYLWFLVQCWSSTQILRLANSQSQKTLMTSVLAQ